MKQKKCYLLAIVLIFIISIIVFRIKGDEKKKTINYIRENHADLQIYSDKICENTKDTTESYDGYEVTYWKNTGMVEFREDNKNLKSLYTGFYYSPEDKPIGFQGADMEFVEQDSGWIWNEDKDNSDNWEYTEKIMDHWYWFEVHF